ncbi:MAG: Indole-3-glycerol phosphate synthase [uncultured Chloroflexi bacterium]|uniref:Indole-3-glycerol phosphate synthase n=1 Tax=uncultured Chloroflexota bacterium TaxID=166587 RepID=A0A6J4IFN3_9CHLR|nr:MAG: Indole-3-glycerol phosphate synthase [uncultured Chloroflexota bacterium]
MTILDDILQHKRTEVAAAQRRTALGELEAAARSQPPARGFAAALRASAGAAAPRLIAEIKKVSPAKGALNTGMDVRAMATLYEAAGASAISVLTDERFFAGSLDDLRAVRATVSIPVLRKDFVISPYQLVEARAAGADAALLIVDGLASPLADPTDFDRQVEPGEPDLGVAYTRLRELLAYAREIGLDCLVETHDEAELDVAIEAQAEVIGLNNRNLRTFETTLAVTERLAGRVTKLATLVSESGIYTAEDVRRVRAAGAHAILVGSSIVSAEDPAAKIRELIG